MVGIRRAFAQLILAFYILQFLATAFLGDDRYVACFAALAGCYALAFFGLAAEWFWARWFAMGLGNFGALALALVFKVGPEPVILFIGLTHLTVLVSLVGEGMAAKYENSEATAERYGFPQDTLALLRRAVKSAGSALPPLILIALGPKEEGTMAWILLGGGALGLWGLLRMRTWGIFVAGATGVLALLDGFGAFGLPSNGLLVLMSSGGTPLEVVLGQSGVTHLLSGRIFGLVAGLSLAIVPLYFAGPIWRTLTARRERESSALAPR